MKHTYKHHAPSGVKTQVWSPLEHIFHQIDRLKWWQECWGKSPSPAAYVTLANINHNLQLAIWAAQNPSRAHTIWTHPEPVKYIHSYKQGTIFIATICINGHFRDYHII